MQSQFPKPAPTEQNWFVVIVAISLTPLIQGLLTTTLDGRINYAQAVIRILSVIAILSDMFIINVAAKNGFFRSTDITYPQKLKLLLGLLIIFAVIAIFSESKSLIFSTSITLRYFLQIFTAIAIFFIIASSDVVDIGRYMSVIVVGGLLYVAYIAMIALIVPHPSVFPWVSGLPSATSIRHIGNYVAIFSIAAIASFLFGRGRSQWPKLAAVFFMIAFLGWTGSRAAFVGIGIAVFASLFVLRSQISGMRIAILAVTMAGALIAAIPLPTPNAEFGVLQMVNASDAGKSDDVSSARFEIWRNTAHEIAEAPMIGHGAGRYIGNMSEKYGYDLDNPHNFVLQFAYDWGLIGLTIALALLAMIGAGIYKMPIVSPLASFCAISGYTLMLTIGMLEGMFYHPLKMLLVSALVAPAFGLAQRKRSAGPNLALDTADPT